MRLCSTLTSQAETQDQREANSRQQLEEQQRLWTPAARAGLYLGATVTGSLSPAETLQERRRAKWTPGEQECRVPWQAEVFGRAWDTRTTRRAGNTARVQRLRTEQGWPPELVCHEVIESPQDLKTQGSWERLVTRSRQTDWDWESQEPVSVCWL